MAVKNAIYQVDNGSGYDEIHFKTKAAQVVCTDGTTVEKKLEDLKQSASNGKSIVATAIGTPLLSVDTFATMGSKIDTLTSKFKTNLNAKGVSTSSEDKMSNLIDKIPSIAIGTKTVASDSSIIMTESVNISAGATKTMLNIITTFSGSIRCYYRGRAGTSSDFNIWSITHRRNGELVNTYKIIVKVTSATDYTYDVENLEIGDSLEFSVTPVNSGYPITILGFGLKGDVA